MPASYHAHNNTMPLAELNRQLLHLHMSTVKLTGTRTQQGLIIYVKHVCLCCGLYFSSHA